MAVSENLFEKKGVNFFFARITNEEEQISFEKIEKQEDSSNWSTGSYKKCISLMETETEIVKKILTVSC